MGLLDMSLAVTASGRTAKKVGHSIKMCAKIAANPSESSTDSISSVETPTSSKSSITVMSTSKSNESRARVYDKRFYCLYCDKPQSKLPRHLLTQDAEEIEVAKYDAETDKNIKAQMICRLRNVGNHRHNSKVIQEGCGMLIVVYRPKGMVSWEQYVPCDLCLGYYVHWDLWKHRKRCTLLPKDKKVQGRVVSHNRLLLPTPKGTSVGLQSLLVTFNSDLVSRVVKSDPLILQLGEKLYHKLGHDKDQFSTIRNTLRELGRLLRSLRQSVGPTDAKLADFINPLHFQAVVSAAKEVAGFSEKTHLFRTPSLALKVGHSIKKCAKILKGNALQVGDEELLKNLRLFGELCELSWTEEISTYALRTLGENKRNVVKLIPLTSDCKLLTDHLKQKGKLAFKALEIKNSNREAWSDLCEAALSQIILFYIRRQGEVSKMTVKDFVAKHSAGEEDVMQSLSPLEQKLYKSLVRIEIVGKRGRTVPVILTAEMKQWMDLLLTTRKTVGVNPEKQFLFARSSYGSLGHVSGCDCLMAYNEECGAKYPKLLRSTKLRKQIATLSQLLNMKENELDILANFLGHDVRVHREFYRLPESTLQVSKVSKLLFSLENGQFSKQQGNSLSDITIDVDEAHQNKVQKTDLAQNLSMVPYSLTVSDMLKLGRLTSNKSTIITIQNFSMNMRAWSKLASDVEFVEEREPVGSGGFRYVYKASSSHPLFKDKEWVIKRYKTSAIDTILETGQAVPEHTKKVVQMHMLARNFALKLQEKVLQENISVQFGNTLSYNKIYYGKTDEGQDVTIEEYVAGSFSKYINNDGLLCKDPGNEISLKAECLCHYSYQKSDKQLLLVDIQGSNFKCYDPEIASTELYQGSEILYCTGNLSKFAIENFIRIHKCNVYCSLLGLTELQE